MKIKLDKNFLISSIMTLITVLVWIGFSVHRTLTKTTITKATQEQMAPLDPKLKRTIIGDLKNNLAFSEAELNQVPAPLIEESFPSEEIENSQEATESAASE